MEKKTPMPDVLVQKIELFTAIFSPMEFYIVLPTLVHQLGGVMEKLHAKLQEHTHDEVGRKINDESFQMVSRWVTDVKHQIAFIEELEKESEGV